MASPATTSRRATWSESWPPAELRPVHLRSKFNELRKQCKCTYIYTVHMVDHSFGCIQIYVFKFVVRFSELGKFEMFIFCFSALWGLLVAAIFSGASSCVGLSFSGLGRHKQVVFVLHLFGASERGREADLQFGTYFPFPEFEHSELDE